MVAPITLSGLISWKYSEMLLTERTANSKNTGFTVRFGKWPTQYLCPKLASLEGLFYESIQSKAKYTCKIIKTENASSMASHFIEL